MSGAPFVDARNLQRVFDVSKPWLNRVLEGGHLEYLKAVNDVTFDIVKGETFALVGESGSGKTSVARMVVALLPPTPFDIYLFFVVCVLVLYLPLIVHIFGILCMLLCFLLHIFIFCFVQ